MDRRFEFKNALLLSKRAEVIDACHRAIDSECHLNVASAPGEINKFFPSLPYIAIVDSPMLSCIGERTAAAISNFPAKILIAAPNSQSGGARLRSPRNMEVIPFPFDRDLMRDCVHRCLEKPPHQRLTAEHRGRRLRIDLDISGFKNFAGKSKKITSIKNELAAAAATNLSVLLTGESGTGKSLAAELIHKNSARRGKNFVSLNMASIPVELAESELFGTVAGAYTGAKTRGGLFAQADGGTLFLDEIAEAPLQLQAKLLRALDSGKYFSVGSDEEKKCDARIVCATNGDIKALAADGKFREDLFWRISDFVIDIPPLRERKEDIIDIAQNFLDGKNKALSPQAFQKMMAHDWPGNARTLLRSLERACALSGDCDVIESDLIALS